jgi:hypothetical protein
VADIVLSGTRDWREGAFEIATGAEFKTPAARNVASKDASFNGLGMREIPAINAVVAADRESFSCCSFGLTPLFPVFLPIHCSLARV